MSTKAESCIYDVRLVQGPVTYEPPDAGMYVHAHTYVSEWVI